MSGESAAVVGTLFGFIVAALVGISIVTIRIRERIARLEQRFEDKVNGRREHHGTGYG